MGKETTRSCIFCRKSAAKQALLRFVVRDGLIVWDKEHSLTGRGAYIHPTANCWSHMRELGRWEYAFRMSKGQFSGATSNRPPSEWMVELMEQVRVAIPELAGKVETPNQRKTGRAKVRF